MRLFLVIFAVEALAASWIEIRIDDTTKILSESKPLRLRGLKFSSRHYPDGNGMSKPLRLRGLKYHLYHIGRHNQGVEAYVASWIEIM